jgi:hypothetical protein
MLYTNIPLFATYFVDTNRARLTPLMAMLVRQDGQVFVWQQADQALRIW